MSKENRIEKDVLGELKVPADAYWGINTQRAIQNFKISGRGFPNIFIRALAYIKICAALTNKELNLLDDKLFKAIYNAANEILDEHKFQDQFPVDIFQTGSGTQTNMNMNEVLANRANELLGQHKGKKSPVHPNNHVNLGQSSNDVFPTAMHISILLSYETLRKALYNLKYKLEEKIEEFKGIIKVGRTHLQDAVPIPLSLEFDVYYKQIDRIFYSLDEMSNYLRFIPIGGTALGTGLNTHKDFATRICELLFEWTGLNTEPIENSAEHISSHNLLVQFSGILKVLSLAILKMANDIRWMGSGPRAGLSELILPANEPGSSIMPGKINPTQCEMLIQVCIQVIGNDTAVSMAESHGSILDLNVCKPIMICNILESMEILSNGINSFVDNCLKGLKPNLKNIESQLDKMLMVVTKLNPIIGYDKASEIAQKAYKENKTIKEVIKELGIEIEGDLDDLLDPRKMV
jgi:fumarate hydratase class II